VTPRIWQPRPCDDAQSAELARQLGISPTTARLLCIRDLADPATAKRFLSPALADLHDPFLLADMREADGAITVTCEFCSLKYRFGAGEIG